MIFALTGAVLTAALYVLMLLIDRGLKNGTNA
jgi:hypothetical protein